MTVRPLIAAVASVFAVAGCFASPDDDLDDEKEATTASALDVGTSSTELGDLATADPAQAAAGVASSKTKGCHTRTVDPASPNVVLVTLEACTGRFGRHSVSGHLTVTFSSNADGSLHSETVSSDLTVDGRPFTRAVSADISIAGDVRHVSRHSEKTGTKKNGDSLVQTEDVSRRDRQVDPLSHGQWHGSRARRRQPEHRVDHDESPDLRDPRGRQPVSDGQHRARQPVEGEDARGDLRRLDERDNRDREAQGLGDEDLVARLCSALRRARPSAPVDGAQQRGLEWLRGERLVEDVRRALEAASVARVA